MSFIKRLMPVVCALTLSASASHAIGWPANYQGVMLQGFYWDSYTDSKWTNLESQADELSKYFKLIWIPNSANCGGGDNMGYMPIYWFTNHNSSFGSEAELLSMIQTFKDKGTGMIADVVINHRAGVTNWTDFPSEEWNGTTWHIGTDGICCTDEVKDQSGQAKPTGGYDTGDDFNGARDLDHTNANVQANCKAYTKCLLEKYGYVGFRYDMVKGYGGQYNKIYNQYSQPTYSVGEYWDSSYDNVANWINATGRESAAFDFPCKYAINSAFAYNDMTKLVWNANGNTPQPAGMIHYGYAQLAVTFVDNHDTYRDGSKFNGNVVAANAFILCSPGTPCVFLPHWQSYKDEIKKLIDVRNAVGVHNCSSVKVLKSAANCYMAEVTGTKGTLVVKIGSAMESPEGYTANDIKASGTDYCVWTKIDVVTPGQTVPDNLYILGNIKDKQWTTNDGIKLNKSGNVFTAKGVELVGEKDAPEAYFTFVTTLGADFDDVNGGDRYGASSKDEEITVGTPATFVKYAKNVDASSAESWKIANGKYDFKVDFSNMAVTLTPAGQQAESTGVLVFYDNHNTNWTTPHVHYWGASESTWPGPEMTKVGENVWMYNTPKGTTGLVFNQGNDQSKTEDCNAVDGHVYTNGQAKYYEGEHYANDGKVYLAGNFSGKHWNTAEPVEMTYEGNHVYTVNNVVLELAPAASRAAGDAKSYFSIISEPGATWDTVNSYHRFGANDEGSDPTSGSDIAFYHKDINGSSAKSWAVAPGTYDIKADFANMKLTATKSSLVGIDDVTVTETEAPVYYNLQGVEISADDITPGIYIERRGTSTRKIIVR